MGKSRKIREIRQVQPLEVSSVARSRNAKSGINKIPSRPAVRRAGPLHLFRFGLCTRRLPRGTDNCGLQLKSCNLVENRNGSVVLIKPILKIKRV